MVMGRAAEFLGIDRGTLLRWHRAGVGPPRNAQLPPGAKLSAWR